MLLALLLAAAPVIIASEDELLKFDYRWSAEAAAVPALDRRFRADAAKSKAAALETAQSNKAAREKMGTAVPGGDFFSRSWTTAGQSPRLLSLEAETGAFTGGAHPNSGTDSLLWDRKRGRETSIDSLLLRPGWWNGAMLQPFCFLLNKERQKRRGEPIVRGGMFSNCPSLSELTVTVEDRNRNHRFDHVRLTADAYVAGPYAEGEYVIHLPLTERMLARLKPEFRPSFEPQPPVQ